METALRKNGKDIRTGMPGMAKESKSLKNILQNYQLYLFILPAFLYFAIFNYGPLYGIQLAFKDFIASNGIWGSPWTGFENFEAFFETYYFWRLIRNTITISLYSLVAGFPIPVLLALMLNEVRSRQYKKIVQTVTYAPHFISTVVLAGMIILFLNPEYGVVNHIFKLMGFQAVDFMNKPQFFQSIYVWTGVWQNAGWNSIIYFAALANVDLQLHESAVMDGASRLKRIWHINVPVIMPTAIILLILNGGSVMSVGFEKVFLLQNLLNMDTSDVISTYIYRMGIQGARYSFSTAVGLFNSIINCVLLIIFNMLAKRFSEISLW